MRPPRDDAHDWRPALLFTAEMLVLAAALAPYERFSRFAYGDSGAEFTVQDLIARGYRPAVDFGYIYGLLPLLVSRLWYAAFGATPAAFRALALACALATAWGFGRLAAGLRVGVAGVALVALAMPDMTRADQLVLVQALEPALLVHALADQSAGRRGRALALVTACAFVKPSMAYVYGALLLVAVGFELRWTRDWRPWARRLAPAAAAGLALAALLGAVYGPRPLVDTLVPGAGAEVYRQGGYGFFRGSGRDFWWRPGAGVRGYLRYEIGYWLAGSAALTLAGLAAASRLRGRASIGLDARRDEVVATCAALHLAFVTAFFGNRFSWIYYLPLLVAGLAVWSARGPRARAVVWAVAALVLLSDRSQLETLRKVRAEEARGPETFGLWASLRERDEWRRVLALTEGGRPVLLAGKEGLTRLTPRFGPPAGAYFVPGHPVGSEVRRKADQLAGAELVVRVRSGFEPGWGGFERWPEIAEALDGLETVWRGEDFEVLRRARPPAGRGRTTGSR